MSRKPLEKRKKRDTHQNLSAALPPFFAGKREIDAHAYVSASERGLGDSRKQIKRVFENDKRGGALCNDCDKMH